MSAADDPFHEPESHENHERYLITYADMITLLMALFIILFAIGQTDLEKYESFREGLAEEFGAPSVLSGGGSLVGAAPGALEEPVVSGVSGARSAAAGSVEGPVSGLVTLERSAQLVDELQAALEASHLVGMTVRAEDRGVLVTLPSDGVTFRSGSWELLPSGRSSVRALAEVLSRLENDVVVEGHTDSTPMTGSLSNWELSTNRATTVVRELIAAGVTAPRMSAAGYADTRPAAPNETAEGRAANRRVEVLVFVAAALDPADGTPTPVGPSTVVVGPPPVHVVPSATPITTTTGMHSTGHD